MTQHRKVKIVAEVDAAKAKDGFAEVKAAGADMAASVRKSGQDAGDAVGKIGDGGEQSAQKVDRATKSIISSIQRVTAEQERALASMESGGSKNPDYFGALGSMRGADLSKLDAYLAKLKEVESAVSVAAAAERNLMAANTFEQKFLDASRLAKASDYVRMWEDELQKAEAAEKRLASQNSFVDGLRREAEAIGKTRSELLEIKAAQMGVSSQAAPFIAALKEQEATLIRGGAAAKQYQWALQGVPAQLTDIVTSLAGGQNPLLVFLQQGGQLKDMFGGAGNAARALGGYVVGLINPFTLAAAAAGALGVAYYQGSKEADALARAIIMTGNAAGASVGQLQDMARAVSAGTGATQGAANEAIAAAASTGKVAAANIELVSQAAIKLNRAVGASIQDTINDFADLGKEPVKASEKLNEKYNYLTASIYSQIKAIEDQGKTLEAAALAQKAYADAMSGRADAVVQNLGTIERAWKGIISTAKSGWDAMLGVGRQATLADQIAEQKKVIEGLRDGAEVGNIDVAQKRLATLEAMATAQGKAAAATASANQQEQARIAWLKDSDKYLTKAEQMERAITKARNEGAAAGASQAEIEKRIAKIREDMTDKARQPRTGKSQEVKDAEELARILDRINGNASGLDASYYTDLQKLFKAYGGGKLTLDQYRDAVEKLTIGQKFYKDTLDAQAKAQKEAEKAQSDYFNHWQKHLGSLDQEAQKLEEQNMLWGLGKQALADMALIRAEDTLAKARDNGVSDEYLAKLEQEVELRRRIAQATGQIEAKEANKKAAEHAAQEWQRVSDDIARSLTDAIFSGGKDGWTLLVDTIKATVIRAYVQPVVQGGINSVLGSVMGAPAGQGGNMFGSLGNVASMGMQAAGMSGMGAYTGAAGFMQLGSMASSFTTGLSAAAAGADLSAAIAAYEAAGMTATAGSLGAGASAAGALGSSAGMLSTALSGLAAAAPYIAVAVLIAEQLGAFKGPTYHKGGAYLAGTDGTVQKATNANVGNFNLGWGAYTSDRSGGYDDAMLGLSTGLAKQISESIKRYGGDALDLTIASRFASDNDDWSEGAYRVMDAWGGTVVEVSKRYTKDANKAIGEFGQDGARVLLAALQKADLSAEYEALLGGLDPLKASVEEITNLLGRAEAIQQQISGVTAGIDSSFLTPAEQLDKAFKALGQSIPSTVQAYEDLVRSQDLQSAAGRDMAAGLLASYQLWQQVDSQQNAVSKERASLEQQLMQVSGDTAGLRALELAKLDESNRALQERIWAIQDEASAAEKAAAALEKAASSADAVASQRAGLERQIMEIMGDTQGIRSRELSAMDASNRALQERIWAIQDETNAQKESAAAAEKIKSTYEQLVSGFEWSIRNVQMSILDNEGKYNYLDNEAARYRDMLMSVSDPQMLESYASKLRATIDQSYSLLTEEQQKASAAEFIARYQAASDLVTSRLNESRNQAEKDRQSMADAFKAAAIAAAEQSAQIIRSAGEAIPPKIDIGVSVSASAGLSAVTEVGY